MNVRKVLVALSISVAIASSATAINITGVKGRLECPELLNTQLCAEKYEGRLLAYHPDLASRKPGRLQIRLNNGKLFSFKDKDGSFNLVELSADSAFLILREQFFEGNTWYLLDFRRDVLREIYGYPLFSPDQTKFVAIAEDLEAQYSSTLFDIYEITPRGVVRVIRPFLREKRLGGRMMSGGSTTL
jgi:hypothetical protein